MEKPNNDIISFKYINDDTNILSFTINSDIINCTILEDVFDKNYITIKGNIKNPNNYTKMAIMAPNPIDKITSFSGKALPYPCEMIAFENTPNFKIINKDGIIDIVMKYPNSYYTPDGYTKIISPVIISLDDKKIIIELKDKCPLKTLRDRQRGNPSFYGKREFLLPIGTAEEVMNNYAYAKHKYNIA
jgi:hypothetical protein